MKNLILKLIQRYAGGLIQVSGQYRFVVTKAGTNQVLRTSPWIKNKIMNGANTGVQLIAQHLNEELANQLFIDSASIGTGTTPPTIADTNLQTPVTTGIARATHTRSGAVVELDFFITNAMLPNATYTEFGLFSDGKLFARSLITPTFTKASGEDVTINYQITLSVI